MAKSVVNYQNDKAEVSDAIIVVNACAERLDGVDAEEFAKAFYQLLEAIDYLDRTFEGFADEHIPG